MAERVDLYDATYGHFADEALREVRRETYGEDIGQDSWTTAGEYVRFLAWLRLDPRSHLLEVASGSGGPALHAAKTTGCSVTGIDANENGVAEATRAAAASSLSDRVRFAVIDANGRLPFADDSFDAMACVDAMNHLPDRLAVLREWRRVLRPGGRAVFTDPVVVTGPVTNDELATRSSIGTFLFVPPGTNDRLVAEAGFRLVLQEDLTAAEAAISSRWHDARERHRDALLRLEGPSRFSGLQRFFATVHQLAASRRLSRIAYFAEKP